MKASGMVLPICLFLAAGLGFGVWQDSRAVRNLDAANGRLRAQLGRRAELERDGLELSNQLAQAQARREGGGATSGTNFVADERRDELVRLRKEIETFQQESNELVSLRADTRAAHDALAVVREAQHAARKARQRAAANLSDAPMEVLQASYGTSETNLDVTDALNARVKKGSLKTIAGNQLEGDPSSGKTKQLTVIYRLGQTVVTNQFREGDLVILPPDETAAAP
jgi:hypothetical protein